MPIALRHAGDPLPELEALPRLTIHQEADPSVIAAIQSITMEQLDQRFSMGHRPYVAWWDGWPAAWGWVATREATIGELKCTFPVPARQRYLWNFVTLSAHRGKGIYPRLLNAIVERERADADHFWIINAPENHASAAGVRKAGFVSVAELSFDSEGGPAVRSLGDAGSAAARLLGLPLVEEPLTPCWHCESQGHQPGTCSDGVCDCDYQKLRAERAA